MSPAAKELHRRRMRVYQHAVYTMVEHARRCVAEARRRYYGADGRDPIAMAEAQGLYTLALEQYFDASERAAGRR